MVTYITDKAKVQNLLAEVMKIGKKKKNMKREIKNFSCTSPLLLLLYLGAIQHTILESHSRMGIRRENMCNGYN